MLANANGPAGGVSGCGEGRLPALVLDDAAKQRVWEAAHNPSSSSSSSSLPPLPTEEELLRREAVLRQCPPRSVLPGVRAGPPFWRTCQEAYHPGRSCAVYHTSELPALAAQCVRLYAPVHLVPLLLFRWKAFVKEPLVSARRAALAIGRSVAFLTGYVTIVKAGLCLQRVERRRDAWWQAALVGTLAGLSLRFEAPKRASELMLYCLPKGIDVAFQLLERRGLVQRVPYGNALMFAAAMAIVLALDRSDFRPTYAGLLDMLFGADQATFHADPVASGAAVMDARPRRTSSSLAQRTSERLGPAAAVGTLGTVAEEAGAAGLEEGEQEEAS